MSMMIDRRRERAIIKVRRTDRLYGTGQTYLTSISVDLGLIEFVLRVFEGDRKRLIKWINDTAQSVDASKIAEEGAAGFSRLMQREMIRLLDRQSKVTPLAEKEGLKGRRKDGKSSASARAVHTQQCANKIDAPMAAEKV